MVLQPLTEHIPHGHRDPVIAVNGPTAAPHLNAGRRPGGRTLFLGQGARQLAQGLLVALVGDLGVIARQLEAHALAHGQGSRVGPVSQTLEEITQRDPQHLGDLVQPPRRYAVDAALVLVGLLVGDPDQIGHLPLAQTQHDAALADAAAYVAVGFGRTVDGLAAAWQWPDFPGFPRHLRSLQDHIEYAIIAVRAVPRETGAGRQSPTGLFRSRLEFRLLRRQGHDRRAAPSQPRLSHAGWEGLVKGTVSACETSLALCHTY